MCVRLVAALLVTLALGEVADAACDPIGWPGSGSAPSLAAAASGSHNGAGPAFCVQDCFCCSQAETPTAMPPLPSFAPVTKTPAAASASIKPVDRPVPQRPPLVHS